MTWALLAMGLVLALLTVPALVPLRHWLVLFPAFFVAWLGSGLAGWWLLLAPAALAALAASGGLDAWPGVVGLAVGVVAMAGLVWQAAMARRGATAFDRVLGGQVRNGHHVDEFFELPNNLLNRGRRSVDNNRDSRETSVTFRGSDG